MAPFCRLRRKNRKRADPEANRINEIRDLKRQGDSARIDFEQKRTERTEGFFPSFSLLLSVLVANWEGTMENPELAQVFEEIADLLDIQGANPFRVRAYRTAARTIRDCAVGLAGMPPEKLSELSGIGKDLAGKIVTLVNTGDLPLRQELRAQVPAGVRDLIHVAGVGPKRALLLHQQLRINSVDDLRQAATQHRIRGLAGFGAKSEEK